jgi:RpiR family carbohydrate utilization transcriptional regulator
MLDRIRASLSSLAPAEQRVGKLVLNDPRAFTQLPVSELADRSHVSKPTVVRFCRSMGYDGLTDFKRKLAGTVSEGVPFIHRSVDTDDKTGDVLVKVIDNTVAAFLKYRNDASTTAIEKAALALIDTYQQRKRVEFFGVGNSGVVAQDAQHKFFRLGFNAVAYSDGHMQVMSASILGPGDCVVVISNSGRTRDLMDASPAKTGPPPSPLLPAPRPWPPAATFTWLRITPKVMTVTAPWCRACCT